MTQGHCSAPTDELHRAHKASVQGHANSAQAAHHPAGGSINSPRVRKMPRWLPRRRQSRSWCAEDALLLARALAVNIDSFRGYCGRIAEQIVLQRDDKWPAAATR